MGYGIKLKLLGVLLLTGILSVGIYFADYYNLIPRAYYGGEVFGIERVVSSMDFNQNGMDDYISIMLGARRDAENKPEYDGSYHAGGYPPENIGVCTDVIWRAFKHAGYDLKEMVDQDIKNHIEEYPRVGGRPEPNIDFRRVPNLKVYFERHAVSLTLDPTKIEAWQPGDIVTYGDKHIGIVSDRRNKQGVPYLIHNGGQPRREEDALTRHREEISGHFRFDASRMEEDQLIPFE